MNMSFNHFDNLKYNKINNVNVNGRVDLLSANTNVLFSMKDKIPKNNNSDFRDALNGTWTNSVLSKIFFSNENIKILQNALRSGVYILSNKQYIIGEQNIDELKIIMRSIYLQNSKNQQTQITQQIEELNKLVLDYCIPQVYNEAIGYMKYCVDVSTLPTPIMRPELSRTDHKQLEFKSWF